MTNTKKSDEKNVLAKTKSADTEIDEVAVTLIPFPKTIGDGGGTVRLTISVSNVGAKTPLPLRCTWNAEAGEVWPDSGQLGQDAPGTFSGTAEWKMEAAPAGGAYSVTASVKDNEDRQIGAPATASVTIVSTRVQATVTLQRAATGPTSDQALWVAIRNRTEAISFNRYDEFVDRLLCADPPTDRGRASCRLRRIRAEESESVPEAGDYGEVPIHRVRASLAHRPNIYGPDAYYLLKMAAQAFLIFESGIVINHRRNAVDGIPDHDRPAPGLEDPEYRLGRPVTFHDIQSQLEAYLEITATNARVLPYLKRIVDELVPRGSSGEALPYCEEILQHRFTCPSLIELIWSYWEEEGMLVQTLSTIARRFQNLGGGLRDPLANLEIDPLRPLNNLLWGFVQDEHNRLTVARRAYEYDHHYGLALVGRAVPKLTSADSRSKFLEAFHNLLHRAAAFFRADADATLNADAFPLLNALKEVHLVLAEGAHNQFGDLPWTARAEMLNMQWFLARPEIREFLRGRHMVPYQEGWMGAVDDMKRIQGWTDVTVSHFHELAVTGERILLSVRYGDWSNLDNTEDQAKNWARHWKPEIQLYIHAYQTVTSIDLGAEITDTHRAAERYIQPSSHLQRRLDAQAVRRSLPAHGAARRALATQASGYPELPAFRRRRLLRYREDE
jgi:hypothetical protein